MIICFCNKRVFVYLNSNRNGMKKKIIYAVCLILFVFLAPSCSKTCKTCKKVYYDGSGTYLREDAEASYCGVELIAIDGKTIDLGALGSAKWECR
jgi:hypothetical protein